MLEEGTSIELNRYIQSKQKEYCNDRPLKVLGILNLQIQSENNAAMRKRVQWQLQVAKYDKLYRTKE